MLKYIKWFFILSFWLLVGAVFHYTLPQVDIARITDTYEKREVPGANRLFWSRGDAGSGTDPTGRDVFFIQTRLVNDKVMVYRNEDTGWGWPPYFKFDTSNLQAEAADAKSTTDTPMYYALKHYGWRNEFLSIFPNAISIRPVDGPNASKGIPYLNIFILVLFFAVVWAIWVRWRRFRTANIDPTLEAMEDGLHERRQGFSQWLGTWRSKK